MIDPMQGKRPRRLPGLVDVARAAGVSVATVSRHFSGTTFVSDEKRIKIEAAVERLGYRPNGAARALVTGWQPLIAVLSGNTTRYGFATTLQGIEEQAQEVGYLVAITVLHSDDEARIEAAIDIALGQPVAGVIVIEFDEMADIALQKIPRALTTVSVASHESGSSVPRVILHDAYGGRLATEHLLALGHETVHHVAINGHIAPSGRQQGWRQALLDAGAPVPPVIAAGWTAESGYDAGVALSQDSSVTAVLCGNDEIAFGLIRALQDRGIRVPEDVSVVGFDDHPQSKFWTPPLTTIRQDFATLGARAVRMVLEAQANNGTAGDLAEEAGLQDEGATVALVVRESTARASARPRR